MSGVAEIGIDDDDEAVSDTGTKNDNNDDLSSWRGTSSLEAQLVTDDPRMRRRTCSLYYVFSNHFFVLIGIGIGPGFLRVVCDS